MKIENFDDTLKRKLENVNTSYEEGDIQKVHDYVTRNRTLGRIRNSKRNWILIGSSMIIAGLITWNIILVNQNRELHQTVNGLHAEFSVINKKQTVISPNRITPKESVTASNNNIPQAIVHEHIVPVSSGNNVSSMAPVKNENVKNIPENNKGENAALNVDNNTPVVAQTSQQRTAQEAQSVKTDWGTSNEGITENIKKDTVIPEKKIVAEVSQPVQDEAANNDKAKDEVKRSLSIFKNIHYNAGVNLTGGRNQVGCGISGEALLKDRWGLSVGMNVLGIDNEKYNDDEDFSNCKHTQFTSTYNLNNNDTANSYFHIKIDDILFQVPVAINYHLELRRKFSLIVGAGTNLDIYVKQHVGYLHKLDSISNNGKLGHQFSPVLFNDLAFTAGIQKRCGLFLFQMCPYVSYQVRQVIYKKEELYYGLRFGIKFNFPPR
jgi:hypothetical protein